MVPKRILLGVIGRPHGVRGLVHVHSYAAEDLAAYSPLEDEAGRRWTLTWRGDGIAELRDASGRPVPDRTAAEQLVNAKLYIDRDRLPEPDEDDFYLSDLVGMRAVGADGQELGRVEQVHDYGAGASLEIEGQGRTVLIPFTKACVPEVDVAGGSLIVVLPEEVDASATEPKPRRHATRLTDGPTP
jgi:16S rRNA processing protein RimM